MNQMISMQSMTPESNSYAYSSTFQSTSIPTIAAETPKPVAAVTLPQIEKSKPAPHN
jgi:hypothetical protein